MQNEELRRTQAALEVSRARYFDLYDLAPVGYLTLGEAGSIQEANLAAAALLHTPRAGLAGQPLTRFILPEDQDIHYHRGRSLLESGQPQSYELRLRGAEDAPVWVHVQTSIGSQGPDETPLWRVILSDISARKASEEALRDNQELLSLFMRHSPIFIYLKEVTPTASRIIQASENFRQMLGLAGQDIVGKTMAELFPPELAAKICADDRAVITKGEVLTVEEHWNDRDYSSIRFPISQGGRTLLAGYAIDITERKRLEKAIERQATTDDLTGIGNRRHFFTVADRELKRARRRRHSLAVAVIDLDHLKRINDTTGHAAGDQALVALTHLCQKMLREIDVVARFGGDEFVLLLPEATEQQAYEVVERIRQALVTQPIMLAAHPVSMTISAGIACLSDEQESLETLLERADQALYQAKRAGRNRVALELKGAPAAALTPGSATPGAGSSRQSPDADRRHHPRRPIAYGVQLQVMDPSRNTTAPSRYQAVARDISADGMRILADRTFPANTPIRLAVEDEEHAGHEPTFHTGSIVWAHPLPGERRCMLGIQFGEGEALRALA